MKFLPHLLRVQKLSVFSVKQTSTLAAPATDTEAPMLTERLCASVSGAATVCVVDIKAQIVLIPDSATSVKIIANILNCCVHVTIKLGNWRNSFIEN